MIVHPDIDPIIFQIGPAAVRWYGLMYLVGFAACFYLGQKRVDRIGISKDQFSDLVFYGAAVGVILGGRMGYALFYQFDRVLQEPLWLFKIWEGGMSFHGGLIGVLSVLAFYSWRHKINVVDLMDFASPLLLIGVGAGRIANFINQELWGRPSDVPWAVLFPNDPLGLARHPSQLYEAFLEGFVLFTLLWFFSQSPKKRGAVSGLGIMCYGIFRSFVEFFREPDAHLGFIMSDWVTQGMILSSPMIVAGAAIFLWSFTQQVPVIKSSTSTPATSVAKGSSTNESAISKNINQKSNRKKTNKKK